MQTITQNATKPVLDLTDLDQDFDRMIAALTNDTQTELDALYALRTN